MKSYLDYFLTSGVKVLDLQVREGIGRSDHKLVICMIGEMDPVRRKRRLVFSKSRAADLFKGMIESDDFERLLKESPLALFRKISGRMARGSIIFERPARSYFSSIKSVDRELESSSPNWKKIKRAIISCRGAEYVALLERLNELRVTNKMAEFHALVGNILRLKKVAQGVQELEDPLNSGEVIHEPKKLTGLLSEKYRNLFSSALPRAQFQIGRIESTSSEEITRAASVVSVGKGLALDCIPDIFLKCSPPRLIEKLVELVNSIFREGVIPTPFRFSRLHLINKLVGSIPTLDDLRPIMISSPIVKVIEAIALEDLKRVLEPRIDLAQVGFLPALNTQTQILRLVGKVIDLRESPLFRSGCWFILFVDFKAAFDKVNHAVLFRKLAGSGVQERTVNILKVLYNSYHFTLPGDIPQRVNNGVAQGSLVSPLLYDWYVNDLISELSKQFGQDRTFAYADDVAVLCLGLSDIRLTLQRIDQWAETNGAQVNRRKCGILKITKRETPNRREVLEGVPFVQVYKYLGVPLDESLSLKHLVPHIKKKVAAFCARIHLVLHTLVGLKTKLDLWQTYMKCHFDYFAPVIAICGQFEKFERMYTKSLKKSLGLPLQTPNLPLIKALGIPSLQQIAAHHVITNCEVIKERFQKLPESLRLSSQSLGPQAEAYSELRSTPSSRGYPRTPFGWTSWPIGTF